MAAGTISSRRGGKRRGRGATKPMAEINVTPFVDVMLVLLIIFMIAAPLQTTGVEIELPKADANPLPAEEQETLTVTLTAEGQIMLQETEVSIDTLIPKLQAIAAERDNDKVFLRADGAIPYEAVMRVMAALNTGGFNNIGLVTDSSGEDDTAATDE